MRLAVILLAAGVVLAGPRTPHEGVKHPGKRGDYAKALKRASERWPALPRRFLEAILHVESRYDPCATSRTGAAGLAQFTKVGVAEVRRLAAMKVAEEAFEGEGKLLEALRGMEKDDAYHPELAIEAAALTLQHYLRAFEGDLAAVSTFYNAGGKAADAVRRHGHAEAKRRGLLSFSQAATYWPHVREAMERFEEEDGVRCGVVEVKASALNVRDDVEGERIGLAARGQRFVVQGRRSGWCEVAWESKRGWVSGDYVTRIAGCRVVEVKAREVELRDAPGDGAAPLGTLSRGVRAVVVSEEAGQLELQFGGRSGWVTPKRGDFKEVEGE